MKVRRRELNVFSISALDIFASGMGAFVLLTLMAMPFFPNISTKVDTVDTVDTGEALETAQQRVEDLERLIADSQGSSDMADAIAAELQAARQQIKDLELQLSESEPAPDPDQSRIEELERQLEAAKERQDALEETQESIIFPHVDLVVCLDVTASMESQIAVLKREIQSLVAVLDRLAPSVGIGLVAFGDREWSRPLLELPITSTTSLTRIESFINRLSPNLSDPSNETANLDAPEAVGLALSAAVRMQWRPVSERRYVIAITDNPAYPDQRQATISTARQFAARDNHYVSTVHANLGEEVDDPRAAERFLRQLASAGNGNYVEAAGGGSMLSTILLAILGT